MKNTTKNILMIIGIFVVLNSILAFKYFRAQQPVVELADDSIIGQGSPVLLELGSHGCIPCDKMAPILGELSTEQTSFKVSFVDVRIVEGKYEQYNIELIPTQIFFDPDGKELFRHIGFYPKEDILAKWEELGIDIKPAL